VLSTYSRFPVSCPPKIKYHVSEITLRVRKCPVGTNLNDPVSTSSSMDNTAASALFNQLQRELMSQVLQKCPAQRKTQPVTAISQVSVMSANNPIVSCNSSQSQSETQPSSFTTSSRSHQGSAVEVVIKVINPNCKCEYKHFKLRFLTQHLSTFTL